MEENQMKQNIHEYICTEHYKVTCPLAWGKWNSRANNHSSHLLQREIESFKPRNELRLDFCKYHEHIQRSMERFWASGIIAWASGLPTPEPKGVKGQKWPSEHLDVAINVHVCLPVIFVLVLNLQSCGSYGSM